MSAPVPVQVQCERFYIKPHNPVVPVPVLVLVPVPETASVNKPWESVVEECLFTWGIPFSHSEAGFKKISKSSEADEDIDLCVDDDDVELYGQPQYPLCKPARFLANQINFLNNQFGILIKQIFDLSFIKPNILLHGSWDSFSLTTKRYTEADIIPCSVEDPDEDKESRALRRAYLRYRNLSRVLPGQETENVHS